MVGSVLFVGHFGAAVGDVVGTSGLVATGGPSSLLGLWLLDAVVALVAAGLVATVVDRLDRTLLTRRIVLVYAVTALIYAALLGFGKPGPTTFIVVAVGERLQNCVVYYTAWSLARDAFGTNVTHLARLRVVSTLGQLAGASAAGATAAAGISRVALFLPLAVAFVVVERILAAGQRRGALEPQQAAGASSIPPPAPAFASLRPTVAPPGDGPLAPPRFKSLRRLLTYVRESRNVRNLLLLGIFNGVGYSVLAFVLARVLDAEGGRSVDALQTQYGLLRALEPLAYASTELLLAPLIVRRLGAMRVMGFTPFVLLAAVGSLFAFPRGGVGIAGSAALQASFAVEAPALSSTIASLPARIRGRVGVLLDSTPYSLGYIIAVAMLGLFLVLERQLQLSPNTSRAVCCAIGVFTSLAGLFAVRRILAVRPTTQDDVPSIGAPRPPSF